MDTWITPVFRMAIGALTLPVALPVVFPVALPLALAMPARAQTMPQDMPQNPQDPDTLNTACSSLIMNPGDIVMQLDDGSRVVIDRGLQPTKRSRSRITAVTTTDQHNFVIHYAFGKNRAEVVVQDDGDGRLERAEMRKIAVSNHDDPARTREADVFYDAQLATDAAASPSLLGRESFSVENVDRYVRKTVLGDTAKESRPPVVFPRYAPGIG